VAGNPEYKKVLTQLAQELQKQIREVDIKAEELPGNRVKKKKNKGASRKKKKK